MSWNALLEPRNEQQATGAAIFGTLMFGDPRKALGQMAKILPRVIDRANQYH
jgi:hypothetical protein